MYNGVNIRDLNGVEASTSQFPLIGYTVFWRLAGIRVSHPDLERALQATGFDKYLPDPPTPRVALRRALAEWIRAKQRIARNLQLQQDDEDQDENNGGRRRTLIRVINRAGSEHLVYALVAEDIDFGFHPVDKVIHCRAIGKVTGIAFEPAATVGNFPFHLATAGFERLTDADDVGSGFRQSNGHRFADAALATRHERGFSIELE
jgi:hypothetical protein